MVVKIFGIATLLLFAVTCSTTEPPPPPDGDNPVITLELEDATCTEAWINLTTINLQLPTSLTLKQNDITKDTINLSSADTLLYIDSLLPNTIYTFEASWQEVRSQMLEVKTLDATSHEINWEVETIGEPGSYALDVAIINENDIWVVGEFQTGESDTLYNAANWDGQNWSLIRVPAVPWYNPDIIIYDRISTLIAFSSEDIWFSEDLGTIVHWDGISYTSYIIGANQAKGTINKIWGTFPDNLYFVGSNGSITNFNGVSFTLMNSNTDINLTDIYGTPDGSEVWACGWNSSEARSIILRLSGNQWDKIWERNVINSEYPYNNTNLSTIWNDGKHFFYFSGAAYGVYKQSFKYTSIINHLNFQNVNFSYRLRGSSSNNMFMVGDDAMVWHYNGNDWIFYEQLNNEQDILRSLDVKDNYIITVGSRFSTLLSGALIIRGRR